MFKKYPFGIAVRVRGDDNSGYRIQYTYDIIRFLPFLTIWHDYEPYLVKGRITVFEDLEEAKKWALRKYNELIDYEAECKERKRKLKNAKKIVWRHP